MSGWGFGNIWGGGGGGTAAKKNTPKSAILTMRSTMDMLSKREKHLESQIAEQDAIARKNVTTNKTAAKTALRRKKGYEGQLEQTVAQQMTLEREISSIETANINKETLAAMEAASKAMKDIHAKTSIEKVDQIMETLREQHAIGEEVAEAISSGGIQADDIDLDEELAELQQEELDQQMLKTGTVPVSDQLNKLPNQPVGPIKGKQAATEEDDEEAMLQRLQAEMAI